MPAVYSQRFAAQLGLNGTLVIVLEPGFVYVLRDFDVYNGAGGTASVFVRGSEGQAIYAHRWALGDGASHEQWHGRQILHPGENLQVVTSLAMDVSLSGYALTAP